MNLHIMKSLGQICLTLIVILSFSLVSFGAAEGKKIIALEFVANTEGELREVINPQTGSTEAELALCFDGVVKNIATGKVVGEAEDCLSPQDLDQGASDLVFDDSIRLIGYTFFHLPGGTILSRGETTVRPRFVGDSSPSAPNTHITGAIPEPGSNSILGGTKRFKDASGTVRLSGAVDMSGFIPQDGVGPIAFTCLFVITLD